MSETANLPDNPDTYLAPEHGWTCFHCGETFRAPGLARAHFGHHVDGEPACRLNNKERGLAFQLRQAEAKLAEAITLLKDCGAVACAVGRWPEIVDDASVIDNAKAACARAREFIERVEK